MGLLTSLAPEIVPTQPNISQTTPISGNNMIMSINQPLSMSGPTSMSISTSMNTNQSMSTSTVNTLIVPTAATIVNQRAQLNSLIPSSTSNVLLTSSVTSSRSQTSVNILQQQLQSKSPTQKYDKKVKASTEINFARISLGTKKTPTPMPTNGETFVNPVKLLNNQIESKEQDTIK